MADHPRDFQLKYVGTRFNGARLPLDVLSDLPAFRDLLLAFAKDSWKRQNSRRKRLPKGFDQSIIFDLIAIDSGSAVPRMIWDRDTAQRNLPGFSDSIEDLVCYSYNELVALFGNAGTGVYPATLSNEHIRALNKFGSSLRENERIEFPGSNDSYGNVIYVDFQRRKEILTRVKETYETRIDGIGTLKTVSLDGYISISSEYGDLQIVVDATTVVEKYDGNLDSEVQFELLVELDHGDHLRSIKDVYQIDLVDAGIVAELNKCRARLDDLAKLEDGWQDQNGRGIQQAAILTASRFLSKRPSLSALLRIYPTADGGVLFEFENGGWDLSVECLPTGEVEFYGVEIDGDKEIDPKVFAGIDQDFITAFDAHVER